MLKNAFELAAEVKAPVLGLYGAEDTGITPDQVEAMKERLEAAGKTVKFKSIRSATWFLCRLPAELSAGRREGWLAGHASLVHKIQRPELTVCAVTRGDLCHSTREFDLFALEQFRYEVKNACQYASNDVLAIMTRARLRVLLLQL